MLAALREFGILVTTLRNHLFGNNHWQEEGEGVLTAIEEEEVVRVVE